MRYLKNICEMCTSISIAIAQGLILQFYTGEVVGEMLGPSIHP